MVPALEDSGLETLQLPESQVHCSLTWQMLVLSKIMHDFHPLLHRQVWLAHHLSL